MPKVAFDVGALRRLYNQNPVVKAILDHVAARKNNAAETTVDRLEDVLGSGRQSIIEGLRALEALGLGTFIVGRRGGHSRLDWKVPMIGAGRAARGDEVEVAILEPHDELFREETKGEISEETIRHSYNLRPDFSVQFELPSDFTEREATRMADYIRTLPFERS